MVGDTSRSNGGEMNVEVRNNATEYRYELWADGEMAAYTQYALRRGRIAFLHTEVYESFEGMGLGGRLARAALDDARARRLVVVPYCPFIAATSSATSMSTVILWPLRCSAETDYEPEAFRR